HPDAAFEWTMNYHFGGVGFIGHFVAAVVGILYLTAIAIAKIIKPELEIANLLGYICLAFVPFWIGMYFLWNEKIVVDGANDNLTGCYMGISVLKALYENGIELENTEVGLLISGSEEAGLRGAKAWCEAHPTEYKDVETIIFAYDTIHEGRFLGVNTKDLNNFVKADPTAVSLFYDAAKQLNVPIQKCSVPLGATDSAAFNQGGYKCVGITAMDHNLQSYYHTRLDSYDNLDPEGLANCFAVSVQALENFENGK
ncbi:MAG: M20/M25/M40 family metallo-hydrolase, partial [Clostridia bacterium]